LLAPTARLREAGATILSTARTRPNDLASQELFVAANVATAEGCAAVADAVLKQICGIDIIVRAASLAAIPAGESPASIGVQPML
jgi:hypothetical protein